MNRKVIVTGASGFLGKKLCAALEQQNLIAVELDSKGRDIAESKYFNALPEASYGHFIHLAAKTFVPDSWTEPDAFLKTNTLGTLNALEFCRSRNIPFTFVSAFVYGNVPNPIREDTVPQPNNPYALSKKLAEDICRFYATEHRMPVTIIRPFNIYGPGQPEHFLMPMLISQAIRTGRVIVGDLSPRRDFIYIDDVIALLCKVIETPKDGIFNAGTGISHSVKEVIGIIEKTLGKSIAIESSKSARKNEIMDTVADISRARNLLNWQPAWTIEKGIEATIRTLEKL